jgi:hypothetical protein
MITCKTWADIWLNEGFATWGEGLWYESYGGYEAYKAEIDNNAFYYLSANPGWAISNPAWAVTTPSSNTLFNYAITYAKGACVVHMLRYVLGDSLFFNVLNSYCSDTTLKFHSATIADFNAVVNQVTGVDYGWFFDQWLFQPNHPVYQNRYDFENVGAGQWKVNLVLAQVQTNAPFFQMPVEVKIRFQDNSDTLMRVMNDINNQRFGWFFDKHPVSISFDPENQIVLKTASTLVGIPASGKEYYRFAIDQVVPNPANSEATLKYSLSDAGIVTITIADISGRLQAVPFTGFLQPGSHECRVNLDGYPSGPYLITIQSNDSSDHCKLIVSK